MDNLTFYNPTRIIFGKDTVAEIGPVIETAMRAVFPNIAHGAGPGVLLRYFRVS